MPSVRYSKGSGQGTRSVYVEIPYFPVEKKLLYTRTDNPFALRNLPIGSAPSWRHKTSTPTYESESFYEPTPSIVETKAEDFDDGFQADQVAGPSTVYRGVDPHARPTVDRHSVLSYHPRTDSPSAITTYTTLRRTPSEYSQPTNQMTGWQQRRTATPYPIRPRQRLSHVEITNLKDVLADPGWVAVKAAYLVSQRSRKDASGNSLRKKSKGKEKAVFYPETSDESEEEEVNYVLGGSPSRVWSGRSYSFGTRSPSAAYTSQPSRYHRTRKEPRYSLFDRFGEIAAGLGMENLEDDGLYVPPDDSEDRRKARKARRLQKRRGLQEDIEEVGAGNYWRDDSGETGGKLLEVTESVQRRSTSPGRNPPPRKLRLTLLPRDSRSEDRIPPKSPRKRKRRYDEVSDSDDKLVDGDLSSSSEWTEDSGFVAKDKGGEMPLDSSLSISRNGKRVHSIWTSRGTQRNLRVFTEEEQSRIKAECTDRWCHMCHKKKLIMACNGIAKGRCGAGFCDHCLARYPLDFDPFGTFSCPKCEDICICGACMQNRAKRGANGAAGDSKPRRRAAPRTKLSKADRAEQKRLIEAATSLQSEAELSDASTEDVAVAKIDCPTDKPNIGTASTLSSPYPLSPSPQLLDRTMSITTIRWSTPSSFLAASPGIQSRSVEQGSPAPPPLPSFHSSAHLEEYSYLRSTGSVSPPRSLSPSSVGAASYFEKQIRLVEAKDSIQKLKEERRKAIPTVSPFEMTSDQVFDWAEPFRKEEPVEQPLHHVKRRYGFPELDPAVILPGQTWVGDVGMFGFDDEVSPSKAPPHRSEVKDVGVTLGQLELRLSRSSSFSEAKTEFVDPILNTDSIRDVLNCGSDVKVPLYPSVSDRHSRAVSGSSETTGGMTPSGSTSTIVSDESDEGFAYPVEMADRSINFLNKNSGLPGNLDAAGVLPSMNVDGNAGSMAEILLMVPGPVILV